MCKDPKTPEFDWNDLRSFLMVVRTGRLTVAAGQLGIDHSTLSRRITALETALKVRLFDRLAAGYVLMTPGTAWLAGPRRSKPLRCGYPRTWRMPRPR